MLTETSERWWFGRWHSFLPANPVVDYQVQSAFQNRFTCPLLTIMESSVEYFIGGGRRVFICSFLQKTRMFPLIPVSYVNMSSVFLFCLPRISICWAGLTMQAHMLLKTFFCLENISLSMDEFSAFWLFLKFSLSFQSYIDLIISLPCRSFKFKKKYKYWFSALLFVSLRKSTQFL